MVVFGSDRVLLYDVKPWNELGFGVPNFGDNVGTLNLPIHGLVDEIGQVQLYIMTHIDAQRKQPPTINTVKRLGKMINRIQVVLLGRMRRDPDVRLEEGHATADSKVFLIHPAPYFGGPLVRNRWLNEYNNLTMIALSNAMQHSDNNLGLELTESFAQDIWSYFKRIKMLLGSELLLIPHEELEPDTFRFAQEHYAAYNISEVVVKIESLDTPGPIFSRLTEDDLKPLLNGIPANLIAPNLKQYPIGPLPGAEGYSGGPLPEDARLAGVDDAKGSAGGTIGEPQV